MISARCPFDGSTNKVGLFVEVKPGEPTPMMWMCEHFVFDVLTHPAWDYLDSELRLNINDLRGVTAHEAEIESIIRSHLVFDETGRVAFAESQAVRDRTKTEAIQLLRSRGYEVAEQ